MRRPILLLVHLLFAGLCVAQDVCEIPLARLKYGGGGDWYANASSLPNLARAVRQRTPIPVCDSVATLEIMDDQFFKHPFVHMTGHGNVSFTPQERIRLRRYLENGGFLWADDNYGLDKSFRREMKALFPENPLVPLPNSHPIYRGFYTLQGLPKIHEHDGEPAQGFGIYFKGRMVVLYTYSSDIGNGMEDLHVHNTRPEVHELAIRMGVNIVSWFFNQ